MTAIMHYTRQLADHAHGITLCGIRHRTDHAATSKAKQGAWVTCPLCELRKTLIDAGLEDMPDTAPNAGRWIQPPFEDSDQW